MSDHGRYRWIDHTAELELAIEAPTAEAVFSQALLAYAELTADEGQGGDVTREVRLDGEEPAALLAAWIDELEFLAETEDLVPRAVRRFDLRPAGIDATVEFRRGQPRSVVKAVTYHRLSFMRARDGYRATVVLDV